MFGRGLGSILGATALAVVAAVPNYGYAETPSGKPVTIGFSMPLTGGLAVNGTSGLLAMQIWAEDTNKKGGLLGRPVKLVYYDDQTNPSLVPGIYTKLLDVDKVDLVISGYASTQIAAAMPLMMERKRMFLSLFGTGINDEHNYPDYFSMIPNGPTPKPSVIHPWPALKSE